MTFAMGGAPAPGSDRILVELFQILKDDAVESTALNMQYAICTQYAIYRLPAGDPCSKEGNTELKGILEHFVSDGQGAAGSTKHAQKIICWAKFEYIYASHR